VYYSYFMVDLKIVVVFFSLCAVDLVKSTAAVYQVRVVYVQLSIKSFIRLIIV